MNVQLIKKNSYKLLKEKMVLIITKNRGEKRGEFLNLVNRTTWNCVGVSQFSIFFVLFTCFGILQLNLWTFKFKNRIFSSYSAQC